MVVYCASVTKQTVGSGYSWNQFYMNLMKSFSLRYTLNYTQFYCVLKAEVKPAQTWRLCQGQHLRLNCGNDVDSSKSIMKKIAISDTALNFANNFLCMPHTAVALHTILQ